MWYSLCRVHKGDPAPSPHLCSHGPPSSQASWGSDAWKKNPKLQISKWISGVKMLFITLAPITTGDHLALTWTEVWSTGTLLTQDAINNTLTPHWSLVHPTRNEEWSSAWPLKFPEVHTTIPARMMNSFLTLRFPMDCATWDSPGMSEVGVLSVSVSVHLPWNISIACELLMALTSQSLLWVDTCLGDFSIYPDLPPNACIYLKIKGGDGVWRREIHYQDHFKFKFYLDCGGGYTVVHILLKYMYFIVCKLFLNKVN